MSSMLQFQRDQNLIPIFLTVDQFILASSLPPLYPKTIHIPCRLWDDKRNFKSPLSDAFYAEKSPEPTVANSRQWSYGDPVMPIYVGRMRKSGAIYWQTQISSSVPRNPIANLMGE